MLIPVKVCGAGQRSGDISALIGVPRRWQLPRKKRGNDVCGEDEHMIATKMARESILHDTVAYPVERRSIAYQTVAPRGSRSISQSLTQPWGETPGLSTPKLRGLYHSPTLRATASWT